MHVAFVIAELAPYAQVGGLGAVAADLPPALARLGIEVTLIVPRHEGLTGLGTAGPAEIVTRSGTASTWIAEIEGVNLIAVDVDGLFSSGPVYRDNDLDRFGRFSVAVPDVLAATESKPDLVHAHDWHTALVPAAITGVPTILTIHNLAHQGWFEVHNEWDLDGLVERNGWVGMLASGIANADVVTTVSPTYAAEIQTPELGMGLDDILLKRGVTGIVNGIDVDEWNPASDPHLVEPYDTAHIDGKKANRAAVLEAFGLRDAGSPVAAVISRFDHQKGLDLVPDAIKRLLTSGKLTLIALGTGDPELEERFSDLAASHPKNVAYRAEFDVGLAHLMEAGADVFLMPSRFEPCGLNQMYSMRYGTIPIVHRTGGLVDTVEPWADGRGTGFGFDELTTAALRHAVEAAVDLHSDADAWQQIMRNAMGRDFSWDASASKYVELYETALHEPTTEASTRPS
ncbi:MAG: glycogen synthase [Acidimicrobiia bacterium]|nr:glycogen synthase [Acidimicrobiia bacterium]